MLTLRKSIPVLLCVMLCMTAITGCDKIQKKVQELEADSTAESQDSIIITAFSNEIKMGEKPDYMAGVEATLNGKKLPVTVDSSKVNLNVAGEYPVTYSATDANGNTASKTVNLMVSDPHKKIIYLTFDDGPSNNTPRILKILNDYGIHATFFVVGHHSNYVHFIADEYKAGHVVAAHTFSHDFSIYRSFNTYFDDLNKIQAIIKKYTGHETNLVRFPGGSSNTAFKKWNGDPGFMMKLTKEVQRRGYQYVDWNGSSNDATVNHPTRDFCIANACHAKPNEICMLMHDTDAKNGTVEALPTIIQFFKDKGYEFRTITSTSYICHHNLNRHSKKQKTAKNDSIMSAKKKNVKHEEGVEEPKAESHSENSESGDKEVKIEESSNS